MLAALQAAGEPLPERRYTHATKPKPAFLKKFTAPKLPQNAAAQQASAPSTAPAQGNPASTAVQTSNNKANRTANAPPAPASPDSAAAKPASIAAQDSASSSDSVAKHENGLHSMLSDAAQSDGPSSEYILRHSRKALFTEQDMKQPYATVPTGLLLLQSCVHNVVFERVQEAIGFK